MEHLLQFLGAHGRRCCRPVEEIACSTDLELRVLSIVGCTSRSLTKDALVSARAGCSEKVSRASPIERVFG